MDAPATGCAESAKTALWELGACNADGAASKSTYSRHKRAGDVSAPLRGKNAGAASRFLHLLHSAALHNDYPCRLTGRSEHSLFEASVTERMIAMKFSRIRMFCAAAIAATSMAAATPAFAAAATLDPNGRSSIARFFHDLFASLGLIASGGGDVSDAGIGADPFG